MPDRPQMPPGSVQQPGEGAKSTRYKHAVRHLLECVSLAPGIQDFGAFETHESFVALPGHFTGR